VTDFGALSDEEILKLTSEQIPALVEAAVELDRTVKAMGKKLAVCKQRLVQEAEAYLSADPETAGATPDFIGCNWTCKGAEGNSVEVTFPEPRRIAGFYFHPDKPNLAVMEKDKKIVELGDIRKLAGVKFENLFAPYWKPAKAFKDLVPLLLNKRPEAGAKLLELCTESSGPRVNFETK
jgi:hypothetical protein